MTVKELKAVLEKLADDHELDPTISVAQIGVKELIEDTKLKFSFDCANFPISDIVDSDNIQWILEDNPDITSVKEFIDYLFANEYFVDPMLEHVTVSIDV